MMRGQSVNENELDTLEEFSEVKVDTLPELLNSII